MHLYTGYEKIHFNLKKQTESEVMEKIFHMHRNKKKSRIAILIAV